MADCHEWLLYLILNHPGSDCVMIVQESSYMVNFAQTTIPRNTQSYNQYRQQAVPGV